MSLHLGSTAVEQVYLSSNKISEAYLGSVKVYGADTGGGEIKDYIQNGLVFHLDGIDKGTLDKTKWVDLVDGITFTEAGGNEVHMTNKITLDRNIYLVGDSLPTFPYTTYSIEVVFHRYILTQYTVVMFNYGGLAFKQNSNYYIGIRNAATGSQRFFNDTNDIDMIVSFANTSAMLNGVMQEVSTGTMHGNNNTYPVIGSMKDTSSSYTGKCDIYSIRVYNRLLTQAEMLHNQKVDNIRFGLNTGLST